MRNYWLFSFVLLFLLAQEAFAETGSKTPDATQGKKKLTIGVLTPLSGGPAEQGTWVLQGAELAKAAVLAQGIEVELKVEDTQADPKLAISALQKLLTQGPLDAVITYGSGVGIALSAPCNQNKVIQMGVATSTPAYRSPDDFTFRNFPSAELEAAFLVQEAFRLEKEPSITVVRINNEYGVGTAKAFTQALEKAGGKVVQEEILEPGASDYRATITKMKARSSNLIYLGVYPNEGALFLKQSRELGLKVPMLASVAILGAKNFFDLVGGSADNLFIASSTPAFLDESSPEMMEFVAGYKARLKEDPSVEQIYAARAYDGLRAIALAQTKCGEHQADCLKDQLFQVKDLKGPSGALTFDRNGDVSSTFTLLRMKGRKFEKAN